MIPIRIKGFAFVLALSMVGTTIVYADENDLPETSSSEDYYLEDRNLEEQNVVIYQDIEGHWAEGQIEALYNIGAIRTPTDQFFGPDKPITRADFLYMILTTKGIVPDPTLKQTNFTDVDFNDWYAPYIEAAYRMGVIHGNEENKFYPNGQITRQEALTLLVRSLGEGQRAEKFDGKRTVLSPFTDATEIVKGSDGTFAYAVQQGYISGVKRQGEAFLYPNQAITRSEAASLIYKSLYQRLDQLQKEDIDGIPVLYHAVFKADVAYAYTAGVNNVGNKTSLGWSVREGLIAVDPTVIPYGTHLYIPGYGYAVAADRGGNIKGLKVDLYMNNKEKTKIFGKKTDLPIYILDPITIPNQNE